MATKPVFKDTDQGPVIRRKLNEMGDLFVEGMNNIGDVTEDVALAKQYRDEAEGFKNTATTKASEAATSASEARTSELAAKASETAAAQSEGNAKDSELASKDSELASALSESNAKASELAAKASETAAAESELAAALSEGKAKDSELASALSESNAKASELASKASETASSLSEANAKASELAASTSETNAALSEANAKASELAASTSETNSALSESNAKGSEIAAKESELASSLSETNAKTSELAASTSETNAALSEANAKASELAASTSETNAKASELAASTSETNAALSEANAKASELAASTSETNSALSESNAKGSEIAAKESELASSLSETNAKTSELLAKDWAIKEGDTVDGVDYSAKHYAQIAQDVVAGSTVVAHEPTGTIEFEGIGNPSSPLKANFVGTKSDVGLDQVDNTSDLDKPVSTATQAALDLKAGASELSDLEDSITNTLVPLIDTKVDKVTGKGLSDENYSLPEKNKLAGIAAGATKNATDEQLRDRSTHTGEQAISTVTGLQSALDSKVDLTDHRLTNSREWTASEVSQAEAEAGTDTTARKWTAQRVRQNVAAYTYSKVEVDNLVAGASPGIKAWQNKENVTQLEVNVYHKLTLTSPRTLKLPLNPPENSFVELYATTGDLKSTIIDPNGKTLMGLSESMEIDRQIYGLRLEFLNNSWRVGM